MKTGAKRECPDRESKPSAQHPHRTHRTHDTTDQWRETILVARPKVGLFSFSPRVSRIYVPSCERVVRRNKFILVRTTNGFLVDMSSLCLRHLLKIRVFV